MSKISHAKLLSVAVRAARKAGRLLLSSYGKLKKSEIRLKSRNDFVTKIDKESEVLVIGAIKKAFPGHAICAEESGRHEGSQTLWIIDPLDGTANYIHQIPLFCVSIGIMHANKIVVGVIYDPLHDELFTAQRGKGAYLNGRKIHVSKAPGLSSALMTTGIPFRARNRFDEYLKSFGKISMATAGMRRAGSAALDLAYVACGRFDGFWELDLSPWDIAAGALLIAEAGGKITDLWGTNQYLQNGDVLCGNPHVYRGLKKITKPIFSANPKAPKL